MSFARTSFPFTSSLASTIARAKPEEAGSGNPDPTMKSVGKSDPATIKGENMPPRGGEDIAPPDGRSPRIAREQTSQEHAKETGRD